MQCCPWRRPCSRSSLFPGGMDRSLSSRIRFSWSSLRRATGQTERRHTRRAAAVSTPSNTSSVPRSRKEPITPYIITDTGITVKAVSKDTWTPIIRRLNPNGIRGLVARQRLTRRRDEIWIRSPRRFPATRRDCHQPAADSGRFLPHPMLSCRRSGKASYYIPVTHCPRISMLRGRR